MRSTVTALARRLRTGRGTAAAPAADGTGPGQQGRPPTTAAEPTDTTPGESPDTTPGESPDATPADPPQVVADDPSDPAAGQRSGMAAGRSGIAGGGSGVTGGRFGIARGRSGVTGGRSGIARGRSAVTGGRRRFGWYRRAGRPRTAPDPRRRLHLGLVVAIVLTCGLAGTAGYAHHRAEARDAAVREALATAGPAAKAIFSYDYRNFDASVANGRAFVTGQFADEYAETTSALKTTAVSEQAVVLAEVSASGVIRAEPGHVELLVYLNQYRRNVNTEGEKVDQNRVVLELRRVGETWRVARATAI